MNENIILVTGATGRQGGAVVRQLLQRGFKVRALTRNADKPAAQSLKAKGGEVIKGDMEDIHSLRRAFKDVYGVFSNQNFFEKGVGYQGEIRQARNLAQAARDENIRHFVQSSIANCDNAAGVKQFACKWEIEKTVDALHLPHTFLRVVSYMDNLLDPKFGRMLISILAGGLKPATRLQMQALDDISWFVAESFVQPDTYLDKTIEIAGDSLTVEEIKQTYSNVIGKTPPNFKFPFWVQRLINRDLANQSRWMNEIGWQVDVHAVRAIHPHLMSFEEFLQSRVTQTE